MAPKRIGERPNGVHAIRAANIEHSVEHTVHKRCNIASSDSQFPPCMGNNTTMTEQGTELVAIWATLTVLRTR
jgi:hypothetical protein